MTETFSAPRFLTARWILPISSDPIEHGAIELSSGRINQVFNSTQFAELKPRLVARGEQIEDFGEAIICPGLINLHTHIEYSSLALLETQASLIDWIPMLMRHVKSWNAEQFVESATLGARRMLNAGTTCILDSSFTGNAAVGAARAGLRAIVALELFGIVESETDNFWQGWQARREQLLARFENDEHSGYGQAAEAISKGLVLLSVAPHAPYTVGPSLTKRAIEWAERSGVVWTMHIAESFEESRWMQECDTSLDAFLQKVHTLPEGRVENISWRACGDSPVEYMRKYGLLNRSLVAAHAVQLNDADIQHLARHSVNVAHCPRSNSRLRAGAARVADLLQAGVSVGFGTDSAASNDDLDVLSEARFAWHLHRALTPDFRFESREAIHRLTLGAARALGLSDSIGSLDEGKLADIAIFNISDTSEVARERPYDVLLYGQLPVVQVFVGGKKML